jgi:hypothetical protein
LRTAVADQHHSHFTGLLINLREQPSLKCPIFVGHFEALNERRNEDLPKMFSSMMMFSCQHNLLTVEFAFWRLFQWA